MNKDMKKLSKIQEFVQSGTSKPGFCFENHGIVLENGKIITDSMIVEPEYQNLKFTKGGRKEFETLYLRITVGDLFKKPNENSPYEKHMRNMQAEKDKLRNDKNRKIAEKYMRENPDEALLFLKSL